MKQLEGLRKPDAVFIASLDLQTVNGILQFENEDGWTSLDIINLKIQSWFRDNIKKEELILEQKEIIENKDLKARNAFHPGLILYGYCCGIFGRDSYGPKKILSVSGKYLTVRDKNGSVQTGSVGSWTELLKSSNHDLNSGDHDTEFE